MSKWQSGPQQSHPFIQFWIKNVKKFKNWKTRRNFFPFINFDNHLYFWPNLKSIFTYQKGIGSKKLFCKMFLKLNLTSKYIWDNIPGANFIFTRISLSPTGQVSPEGCSLCLVPHMARRPQACICSGPAFLISSTHSRWLRLAADVRFCWVLAVRSCW